jgi:NTP pyrophosphatase (non-canonical NTP hydrolase)
MSQALTDVVAERARQDAKWGEQNHDPFAYLAILMEEVGETAKEAVEMKFSGSYDVEKLRTEAVQTAAVAVAFVECMDRAEWRWA